MNKALSKLDQRLLNEYQRNLPLLERPFAEIAKALGTSESDVIRRLERLIRDRQISRVGAIIPPNVLGASLLVAMSVPNSELDEVGNTISSLREVNHNYVREHRFNLWFVMNSLTVESLEHKLNWIEANFGYPMLRLPLLEEFHIDLGFPIAFEDDASIDGKF